MISRPCYCSREDAQRAVDFHDGVDVNAALDRALQSAADNIEAHLHRVFYPIDATYYFDWPNQGGSGGGQYAYPWRLWFDQHDCVVLTAFTSGATAITLDQVFLEPVNKKPGWPYRYLELDRSSTAAFGGGVTPQHSLILTGTWGFTADADQVATLSASVGSTDTSITVDDGSQVGVGDLVILGYGRGTAPFPSASGHAGALAPYTGERILVAGKSAADTGLTQAAGCATISMSDNALTTTGTGTVYAGEVIQLDSEQMLVLSAVSGALTVRRAWNGTVLADHSGAAVYALRTLTVSRAQLGTTATTYSAAAAVYKHRVPSLVRDLAVAESVNRILQEGSGYARTVGEGPDAHPAPGLALADLWDECRTAFGRKARYRGV